MSTWAQYSLALVAAVLFIPAFAKCQEASAPNQNWDIGIWSAIATGEEHTNSFTESQILTAGLFVGRIIKHEVGTGLWRGNFQYGFSVAPLLQLRPQHLYGIALEPAIFRWNSAHSLGRAFPYIELAGGGVHTSANLPTGDTSSFNFTAKGGGGIYLPTTSTQALDLGLRWAHISNANLGRQNAEFNGIELRVGYHWFK